MTVLESPEHPEVFQVTLLKGNNSATASTDFDKNFEKLLEVVKADGTILPTLDSAGDAVYKASQLFLLFGKKHASFQSFNNWWNKDPARIKVRQQLRNDGLISYQRFGSNDVECLSLATFQAHFLIHLESEHPLIKQIIANNGYMTKENLILRHQQRKEEHERHVQQIYGDLIHQDPFQASDEDLKEVYKIGVRNGQIKWAKAVMYFNKINVRMTSHDGKDKWWGLGELSQHCAGYGHIDDALKAAKKLLATYECYEAFTREVDKVAVIQIPTFVDKVLKGLKGRVATLVRDAEARSGSMVTAGSSIVIGLAAQNHAHVLAEKDLEIREESANHLHDLETHETTQATLPQNLQGQQTFIPRETVLQPSIPLSTPFFNLSNDPEVLKLQYQLLQAQKGATIEQQINLTHSTLPVADQIQLSHTKVLTGAEIVEMARIKNQEVIRLRELENEEKHEALRIQKQAELDIIDRKAENTRKNKEHACNLQEKDRALKRQHREAMSTTTSTALRQTTTTETPTPISEPPMTRSHTSNNSSTAQPLRTTAQSSQDQTPARDPKTLLFEDVATLRWIHSHEEAVKLAFNYLFTVTSRKSDVVSLGENCCDIRNAVICFLREVKARRIATYRINMNYIDHEYEGDINTSHVYHPVFHLMLEKIVNDRPCRVVRVSSSRTPILSLNNTYVSRSETMEMLTHVVLRPSFRILRVVDTNRVYLERQKRAIKEARAEVDRSP